MKTKTNLKILFAAAECAPLAKAGGLGDVIGSLPKALNEISVDARIILPRYSNLPEPQGLPLGELKAQYLTEIKTVKIFETILPGSSVKVFLLEQAEIFGSGLVYENANAAPGGDKEVLKFLFFSECVAVFLKQKVWDADLLHIHDWHLATAALLLKNSHTPTPSLLTIHNLAMQGRIKIQPDILQILKLKPVAQTNNQIQQINLLDLGIKNATAVSTVSPSYAREILTNEYGEGLEKSLQSLANITGILNGIDGEIWNPETDELIEKKFNAHSPEQRYPNKLALQKQLNLNQSLETPLIGIVSRLTGQKGFNLLKQIESQLFAMDFQMAVLGLGDTDIEKMFSDYAAKYPGRVAIQKKFDEKLAHLIYAGSDLFLMPSQFEPCGLGQLIAMRYGSLPIVRATGGLSDSVINLNDDLSNITLATGFMFKNSSGQSLLAQIKRALEIYKEDAQTWKLIRQNAMLANFSWHESAKKYRDLYLQIINN